LTAVIPAGGGLPGDGDGVGAAALFPDTPPQPAKNNANAALTKTDMNLEVIGLNLFTYSGVWFVMPNLMLGVKGSVGLNWRQTKRLQRSRFC
jgi:hypothetical protein